MDKNPQPIRLVPARQSLGTSQFSDITKGNPKGKCKKVAWDDGYMVRLLRGISRLMRLLCRRPAVTPDKLAHTINPLGAGIDVREATEVRPKVSKTVLTRH